MKRTILTFFFILLLSGIFTGRALAQEPDTVLSAYNVFDYFRLPGPYGNRINIIQSDSIEHAVNRYIEQNRLSAGKMQGFRVRIFFDNKQTARTESENIAAEFSVMYPGTAVYRIYENPYFKVTVGDFRTKSEAMRFMQHIRKTYPQAFITRESIYFPML
jgi:hypothetical protein